MKIIKITPSKNVKDRYYVDFEDGTKINANVALIADYSLFTGRELDEDEFESLKKDAADVNLKARALRMVGTRAMSRKEISDKLCGKGADEEAAAEVVQWLEKVGIIDDEEYSKMIVRHYSGKGYGTAKIRNELYRRGVPKEYWEEAMKETGDTEEILDKLIMNKLRGSVPDKKELKKTTDMLLRRGFSWADIKKALGRYGSEIEEWDQADEF